MNKSTSIILSVMGVFLLAFFGWALWHKSSSSVDVGQFDQTRLIEDTSLSGGIAEHIEGKKDAKVIMVEYSDYQCSGCASVVSDLKKLEEKYKDDLAVIHRTYVLSYHDNGFAAASAAEAAGLQGYWKAYGDYLFANQSDWYYSDTSTRSEQFLSYFETVTEGKGDKEKFMADYASDAVKAKVNFDISLAKKVNDKIQYTPAFFIDGEFIDWAYSNEDKLSFVDFFSRILDEKLAK